jgi:hypothetical protein
MFSTFSFNFHSALTCLHDLNVFTKYQGLIDVACVTKFNQISEVFWENFCRRENQQPIVTTISNFRLKKFLL